MKAKLLLLLPLLGAWLTASCTMVTPPPPGDFNISVQGAVYAVNGIPNPEITLTRGMTYTFSINTSGHPFIITASASGGTTVGEETTGVSGSRTQVGTLTFTPDDSHVDPLYYQCSVHLNMGNKINIID